MTKQELINKISEEADITKKSAEEAIKSFVDAVIETVKADEKLQLVGFGTFEKGKRAARTGHNPQTGEMIEIPEATYIKFKASKKALQ